MKFIEKVFWVIISNKLTLIMKNNSLVKWIIRIVTKWSTTERSALWIIIVSNIFILSWFFAFITIIIADICMIKYTSKTCNAE